MQTADQVSTDADVHMMADGRRLPASRVGTNNWQFMVPANTLFATTVQPSDAPRRDSRER